MLITKLRRRISGFRNEKPPRGPPPHLTDAYTLQGRIPIEEWYFDDSSADHSSLYTEEIVNSYIEKIKHRNTFYYRQTDTWLYEALDQHPIAGTEVAIMGSERPLYESVCLAYGGSPITIEYRSISCQDPRLKAITPRDYNRNPHPFNFALSISSFEHDGLGRYGDPLNPCGDLEAMQKMKTLLNPAGLMFLAVPVGKDKLVWNAHRIYGPLRLPLLLQGWDVMGSYGFHTGLFDTEVNSGQIPTQPVFVLRNRSDSNES